MDAKPQPDSTLPSSCSTVGDVNSEGNEDYFKTFNVLMEYLEKRDFKKFIIDKEILRELMEHPDPKTLDGRLLLMINRWIENVKHRKTGTSNIKQSVTTDVTDNPNEKQDQKKVHMDGHSAATSDMHVEVDNVPKNLHANSRDGDHKPFVDSSEGEASNYQGVSSQGNMHGSAAGGEYPDISAREGCNVSAEDPSTLRSSASRPWQLTDDTESEQDLADFKAKLVKVLQCIKRELVSLQTRGQNAETVLKSLQEKIDGILEELADLPRFKQQTNEKLTQHDEKLTQQDSRLASMDKRLDRLEEKKKSYDDSPLFK